MPDRVEDYRSKSHWLTTAAYSPRPPLAGDVTVDVAVVGAGYTGLTSAYFLRQADPGLRVAVLEAQVAGFGASGRNAGFAMTKIGMTHSLTALRFGRTRAREAHEYADRAVTLLRTLVADLGLDAEYEHPGFLWVATSPRYVTRLRKEIALVHRMGITGIHLVDAAERRARVDSPLHTGEAWWEPNCGLVNPAKLAWEWARVAVAAGVDLYEGTPVTSVRRDGAVHVLATPGGTVRASKVVFATNAWSHLFPQFASRQVPVWTYVVLTEPLDPARRAAVGWAGREGVEDFRNLVHYYRLTSDDRILIGGRDVGLGAGGASMDHDRDGRVFAALRDDLVAIFPQLRGVRFDAAWGGPVSAPLDMFPALGYAGGKDVVYSFGCVGHGVASTHLHGQTVRDLVLERDTDLTATFFVNRRVVPFPPDGLGRAAAAGIAGYMRWEDRRLDVLR